MKNNKFLLAILSGITIFGISACNGGSSSTPDNGGDSSDFASDPTPPGGPIMSEGNYKGIPFSQLAQPNSQSNGILSNIYPESYLPTFASPQSLQIAYGRNNESAVAKISAYVTMSGSMCSATPVKYESTTNTTFLIGAAHCFVANKTNANELTTSNIESSSDLRVFYGVSGAQRESYPVTAVYLTKNYCYGATFSGSCPNFSPTDGVSGGQGNDIAVIQIQGEFGGNGNHINYPHVVPASEYPTTYSNAPILSIGYGVSRQTPGNDTGGLTTMYYVAGYQYWQQDTANNNSGYHYLYNSYYNSINAFNSTGYTALICGGDSGGGDLFWTGSKWILLSEHTYGPSKACGQFYSYLPNGATNVSAYYNWIMSIFNSSNPVASCNNGTIPNCVTNG
jgi:hypothetical protein